MNPGNLKHKIDVYGNTTTINELNETSVIFEKIKSLYSEIIPQTASLRTQQADTILTDVTHKIIVRYESGKMITKDMRIKYRDHNFEIKYILNPRFENKYLEIFVQEVLT